METLSKRADVQPVVTSTGRLANCLVNLIQFGFRLKS